MTYVFPPDCPDSMFVATASVLFDLLSVLCTCPLYLPACSLFCLIILLILHVCLWLLILCLSTYSFLFSNLLFVLPTCSFSYTDSTDSMSVASDPVFCLLLVCYSLFCLLILSLWLLIFSVSINFV